MVPVLPLSLLPTRIPSLEHNDEVDEDELKSVREVLLETDAFMLNSDNVSSFISFDDSLCLLLPTEEGRKFRIGGGEESTIILYEVLLN
mmetsp:Transcript_7648/g.10898  ORF Transcript_7648/g.10898 Transcript_7648/m.10898 type:complete len:89 (-) Transcript_7648:102-368(-)